MKPKVPFKRNEKDECLISTSDFVKMLTTNKHRLGYYHLTRWSSLCKMMEPVAVPGDKVSHRMLHLGAAVNMNDEDDKRCGKRVYFSSFAFGPLENIAMWTNYGIPNQEAVRIKIPVKEMLHWVSDYKEDNIGVYGVNTDGTLEHLSDKAHLRLVDVAYWSKKELGRNRMDPNEGLFFYDGDKFRLTNCKDVNGLMRKYPYLFKKSGWQYEKEVRLVLEFEKDMADRFKRVAVPFDEPLNIVDIAFSKYVTKGPWFTPETMPKTKAAGHSLSEANQSTYIGFVKMRSVCDDCEQNGDACKCPFQGQR